ncbi:unnamed protein product [Soboliphyme baturini]|uniref:TRAUB domain-containing protein n=1 Tax=Soboliphyme baturini TaxID=241478 RepID=A0A183IZX1_9BILA|nr:unnamed protein product [Soboliphyme baturini]
MAIAELEVESGVRNVNELIAQKLDGRTVKAIKKRRQTMEYKLILEERSISLGTGLLGTLEEEVNSGDEALMKAVTGPPVRGEITLSEYLQAFLFLIPRSIKSVRPVHEKPKMKVEQYRLLANSKLIKHQWNVKQRRLKIASKHKPFKINLIDYDWLSRG